MATSDDTGTMAGDNVMSEVDGVKVHSNNVDVTSWRPLSLTFVEYPKGNIMWKNGVASIKRYNNNPVIDARGKPHCTPTGAGNFGPKCVRPIGRISRFCNRCLWGCELHGPKARIIRPASVVRSDLPALRSFHPIWFICMFGITIMW